MAVRQPDPTRIGRRSIGRRSIAGVGIAALAASLLGATGSPAATAAPGAKGDIDAAVARLDTLAADLMAKSRIPGMAVAVVHGGKTIYAKGFGVRKAGAPGKVDPDTVFQLASVSKSIGATVVAHQVGERVVSWDTPVRRHLPWFRLKSNYVSRNVTVGDLYAHRSGLPGGAGDLAEVVGFHRKQVLRRLRYFPLSPFRNTYAYSNFGLTAGGEAVARASGKSWAGLSQQVLYRPLGMRSTSSRFKDFVKRSDRAYGHVKRGGSWVPLYVRQPDAQSPAGGVSSSVNDLGRWLAMILGNGTYRGERIVKPAALLPALSPQSPSRRAAALGDPTGFYGYGFNVSYDTQGNLVLAHSGAFTTGAGTAFTAIPALDLAIVTLTNAAPTGVAETLNSEFMDLARFGSVQRDWWAFFQAAFAPVTGPEGSLAGRKPPADARPARALSAYTGTYSSPVYGRVRVKLSGKALRLVVGPAKRHWKLRHWSGDRFALRPGGEDANPGSAFVVRFERFRSGSARAVWFEYFDLGGRGTFRR